MARTIIDSDAAAAFARVIASDLSLYHEEAITESLRGGAPFSGLEEELTEARILFLERVLPELDPPRLLHREVLEFFERWAGERGLPTRGMAKALEDQLVLAGLERRALVVRAGLPEVGRIIRLPDGVIVLGRSRQADVELAVETVARRHTKLTVSGNRVEVEDMASHCGTFVNDAIVRTKASLALGDSLRVGSVILELIRA